MNRANISPYLTMAGLDPAIQCHAHGTLNFAGWPARRYADASDPAMAECVLLPSQKVLR